MPSRFCARPPRRFPRRRRPGDRHCRLRRGAGAQFARPDAPGNRDHPPPHSRHGADFGGSHRYPGRRFQRAVHPRREFARQLSARYGERIPVRRRPDLLQADFSGRSVSLGWSAIAVHWLSAAPATIEGHIWSPRADRPTLAAFARQSAQDWRDFLTHRAAEMRPGTRLAVIGGASDAAGDSGANGLMDMANAVLRDLVAAGGLSADEYRRMTIPTYNRTPAEFTEPFTDGAASGLDVLHRQLDRSPIRSWRNTGKPTTSTRSPAPVSGSSRRRSSRLCSVRWRKAASGGAAVPSPAIPRQAEGEDRGRPAGSELRLAGLHYADREGRLSDPHPDCGGC